jgi:predicted RNA binding protein YcfA (HicA-like mRNA interferase family)
VLFDDMSKREQLRNALLNGQIPTNARFTDAKALFEEAGWTLDQIVGSHHMFVKAGKRTEVVAVHDGKVRTETLRSLSKALKEAGAPDE